MRNLKQSIDKQFFFSTMYEVINHSSGETASLVRTIIDSGIYMSKQCKLNLNNYFSIKQNIKLNLFNYIK